MQNAQADVVTAERHVADAERRVAEQELRLEDLRRGGRNVAEAERLLTNMQDLLVQFRLHREQIARQSPSQGDEASGSGAFSDRRTALRIVSA